MHSVIYIRRKMRLLFVFTKVLVFAEIKVKIPKVRKIFSSQLNTQWDYIVSKIGCFLWVMRSREKRNKESFD